MKEKSLCNLSMIDVFLNSCYRITPFYFYSFFDVKLTDKHCDEYKINAYDTSGQPGLIWNK